VRVEARVIRVVAEMSVCEVAGMDCATA
jgi:hypothetical protein